MGNAKAEVLNVYSQDHTEWYRCDQIWQMCRPNWAALFVYTHHLAC